MHFFKLSPLHKKFHFNKSDDTIAVNMVGVSGSIEVHTRGPHTSLWMLEMTTPIPTLSLTHRSTLSLHLLRSYGCTATHPDQLC